MPILLHVVFALFILVTIDVVYVNSARFKHVGFSCQFSWVKLQRVQSLLKLKQLIRDGDMESNPGPTQNDSKSPFGCKRKIKIFKATT